MPSPSGRGKELIRIFTDLETDPKYALSHRPHVFMVSKSDWYSYGNALMGDVEGKQFGGGVEKLEFNGSPVLISDVDEPEIRLVPEPPMLSSQERYKFYLDLKRVMTPSIWTRIKNRLPWFKQGENEVTK